MSRITWKCTATSGRLVSESVDSPVGVLWSCRVLAVTRSVTSARIPLSSECSHLSIVSRVDRVLPFQTLFGPIFYYFSTTGLPSKIATLSTFISPGFTITFGICLCAASNPGTSGRADGIRAGYETDYCSRKHRVLCVLTRDLYGRGHLLS